MGGAGVQQPRSFGPGLSDASVQLSLQVGEFRMHRADCIPDPVIQIADLLAGSLCAITDPFEFVDTQPDTILISG